MSEITINDTPLSTFGAIMLSGSYEALLTPADIKDYVSNDDPSKNGTDYSVDLDYEPKVKERQVTLLFGIKGRDMANFMMAKDTFIRTVQDGMVKLYVPEMGRTFFLLYETCTSFNYHYPNACDIAVRFIEPDPSKTAE